MIGRTIFAAVAALVLSAGLMMTPAQGKGGPKCGKLCKTEIATCRTGCDSITSKKEKKRCKSACRRETLQACTAQPTPRSACLPASPSGAFLD